MFNTTSPKLRAARRFDADAAVALTKRRRWFDQMIPENWVELHQPGLRAVFHQQVDEIVGTSPVPQLFNEQTSDRPFEETFSLGGVSDFEEFNGTIQYDQMRALWKTVYRHKSYVKGWQIDEDTIADDQYAVITREPREYGLALGRTREKHAANVFNNAFDVTNHAGFDGVALCSAGHPLTPGSADVQSNLGTSAFSHEAIVTSRRLMRRFTDSRGELMTIMPDTLIVPLELEDQGMVITESLNKPGTANNDTNTQRNRWKLVVWDYLTDPDNWFMVDSRYARLHNWWWTRQDADLQLDPQSRFNRVVRGNIKARWSTGYDDWRWIFGHQVA